MSVQEHALSLPGSKRPHSNTDMKKVSQDKRRNARYHCAVPVEAKRGTAFETSRTVDVSKNGAGLIVNKPIRVDSKMAVELQLAADGEPIIAIGRVTWIQQLPSTSLYRVGLAFTDLEDKLKNKIDRFFD